MATSYTALVEQLYISYFGRPSDVGGELSFETQLAALDPTGSLTSISTLNTAAQSGSIKGLAALINSFDNSAESVSLYGAIPATGATYNQVSTFVNSIYQNVLGRAADSAGAAFWISAIQNGYLSLANAALAITEGAVSNTSTQGLIDAQTVANKLAAAKDFTSTLQNSPTLTLPNAYSGSDAAAAGRTLLNNVTATTTVTDSHTAVLALGQALVNGLNPIVFKLTTDVDTQTAGVFQGTDLTWTPLDKLTGTAGSTANSLTIAGTASTLTIPVGATLTNIQIVNLADSALINANTTGLTGVTTLNVTSGTGTTVIAAATTNVNELNSINTSSITGGNNVVVAHSTAGTVTVADATGSVTVTDTTTGGVFVTQINTATGAETIASKGSIYAGGTSLNASIIGAVAKATQVADVAASAVATAAAAAASTADTAAGNLVTAVTNLGTAVGGAASVAANNLLTLNAANAGSITQAQMIAINTAYYNALNATGGTVAAAKVAAAAVVAPITTADTAAKVVTAAALIAANTASTAATGVVTANVTAGAAAAIITDTANVALTTATVSGNYSATALSKVVITDASSLSTSLTTVNLTNAGGATLTGQGLVNVHITDGANGVTILNTATAHTENLTLTNVAAGTITDGVGATTVNVISNGTANAISLVAAGATALNISGAGNFTDSSVLGQAAAVITSTSTGKVAMHIGAGQTFVGGNGVNTITTSGAAQTKTVTAGSGTADMLIFTDGTTGVTKFVGFDILQDLNTAALDVSTFTGSAFTSIVLNNATANVTGLTATQAANISDIFTGNSSVTLGVTGATTVAQLDTVHLTMNDGSGITTVAESTLSNITAAGVETINLTAATGLTVSSLTGAAAMTAMHIDGAAAIQVTTGALALNVNTIIDAHLATGAVTLDTSSATSSSIGLKIIGSATGANTLTGNTYGDVITGGNGHDTIVNNAGANVVTSTITDGNGNDTITLAGTADSSTINVGNGFNSITAGSLSGTVTMNVGTGSNNIVFGAATTDTTGAYAVNIATGHVAAAGANDISVGTAGTAFATAANLIVTGAVTGDIITFAGDVGATLVGTGLTAGAGTITATTITSAATTVALAIGQLEVAVGSATAHEIAVGVYGGNTYIVETNTNAAASGTTTTVIEIVGSHTFTAAAGAVQLAS